MEKTRLSVVRNGLSVVQISSSTPGPGIQLQLCQKMLAEKVLEASHGRRSNLTPTFLDKVPQTRSSPPFSGWMAIKYFLSSPLKECKCWTSFRVHPKDVCSDIPKDVPLILIIQNWYL